jgi:hypothetical protein
MAISVLVDSYFPRTFHSSYTNICSTRNGTKAKPKQSTNRSMNEALTKHKQGCRLGGAEATAVAAAPPGLSQSGQEALHWV